MSVDTLKTKHLAGQNQDATVRSARGSVGAINNPIAFLTHHKLAAIQVLIAVVVTLVLIAGRVDRNKENAVLPSVANRSAVVASIDEVSSANIASQIATGAGMLVSDNVRNKADSLEAQIDFATTEGSYLSKPNIVTTEAKSAEDVEDYAVQAGDTIDVIAQRFNITSDTIRWANDIQGNIVSEGRVLTIPPVSGILYTVAEGDTAESIAEAYKANAAQIIAFNDGEIKGLTTGQEIVIPDGEKPAPVAQPVFVATGSQAPTSTAFSFGSGPLYGGNGYSYGYCTWHTANRRLALGLPMPRNLGNAVTWASLGAIAGLDVSGTPRAGSILWDKRTYIAGGLGHVAFVESVNSDGSILVSDMNYPTWGVMTTRNVPVAEQSAYLFIY